jgi:hypothetical protein
MPDPHGEPLLTGAEHTVIRLVGEAWTVLRDEVVAHGPHYAADLAELTAPCHHIQRAVLAQAAARDDPDRYRLLGAALNPPDREAEQ